MNLGQNKISATILITEDEEKDVVYIKEILRDINIIIICANDSKETVEACKKTYFKRRPLKTGVQIPEKNKPDALNQ